MREKKKLSPEGTSEMFLDLECQLNSAGPQHSLLIRSFPRNYTTDAVIPPLMPAYLYNRFVVTHIINIHKKITI